MKEYQIILADISGDSFLKHGGIALVILAVLLVVWLVVSYYDKAQGVIGKIIRGVLIFMAALVVINFLLSLIGKAFINW